MRASLIRGSLEASWIDAASPARGGVDYHRFMGYRVTLYRDGDAALTVEVDASCEEDAVKTALASDRVPERLLDGPWTATVDSISP
jgi:hypothetical protein